MKLKQIKNELSNNEILIEYSYYIKNKKSQAIIKNEYIYALYKFDNKIYVCSKTGLFIVNSINKKWHFEKIEITNNIPAYSLAFNNDSSFWIGSESYAYLYTKGKELKAYRPDNTLAGRIMVANLSGIPTFYLH